MWLIMNDCVLLEALYISKYPLDKAVIIYNDVLAITVLDPPLLATSYINCTIMDIGSLT